jgi:hypothetical protein
MQYKIPVQIENEDPIILGLSLKQLSILIGWGWIAYIVFSGLSKITWPEVALLPAWIIFIITLLVVFLKISEMTFLPYILNLIRQSINGWEKKWIKWVDSFQPIDIWYVKKAIEKKETKIEVVNKKQSLEELKDKLKNI